MRIPGLLPDDAGGVSDRNPKKHCHSEKGGGPSRDLASAGITTAVEKTTDAACSAGVPGHVIVTSAVVRSLTPAFAGVQDDIMDSTSR